MARSHLKRVLLACLGALLLSPTFANPGLLPADTVLAVGLEGLSEHEARFRPFIDEFERAGLADSLGRLFGDAADELPDVDQFSSSDFMAALGDSGWFGLSVSSSNPLPALTIVTRPDDHARGIIQDAMASLESEPSTQVLTEGAVTFLYLEMEAEDMGGFVAGLSVTLTDDYFAFSTNPDVMRGVLRRAAGAAEPSLETAVGYSEAAAIVGSGNVHTYVDIAALGTIVNRFARPFAVEFGVGGVLTELVTVLETLGVSATSATITAGGVETTSVQLIREGNDSLRSLLLDRGTASRDALAFVPEDALSVSVGMSSADGWWSYLNEVLARYPELGIPSLDMFFQSFVGIDIRVGFLNWVGEEFATITTGVPAVAEPGIASDNLLGEALYLFRTSDDTGARSGLGTLMQTVGNMVAMFGSLNSSTAQPMVTTRDVAGVTIQTLDVTDGLVVSWAVTDGFVLVSTDNTSIEAGLQARATGEQANALLLELLDQVPASVAGFMASDDRQTYTALASQLPVQLQTVAGLSGGDLDFDALDSATAGMTEFLLFVAGRMEGSYGYTVIEGDVIRSFGSSRIDW